MDQDVLTSHPVKNTIMIYEKCIAKFRLISRFYDQYKFRNADEELDKLERVFLELKMQVDEKANEGLAEDLYNLYDWILVEIQKMKMFRKNDAIKDIEAVLNDLIEGYEGALKKHGEQ